jgi:methyl-accepting chemotaxis protein
MLLFFLPPVAIAIAALTFLAIDRASEQEREAVFAQMTAEAQAHANEVDTMLERVKGIAQTTAGSLEAVQGTQRQGVLDLMRPQLDGHADLQGMWAGYYRNAFDGADDLNRDAAGSTKTGIFGPNWVRGADGKLTSFGGEADHKADYWAVPVETGRPYATEPYIFNDVLMASGAAPIEVGGKAIGVAGVNLSLASMHDELKRVKLLESGYAMLVSRTGIFVSAPDQKLIGKGKLSELAATKDDPQLAAVARAIAAGRSGRVETTDPFTGDRVELFYAPVRGSRWGFIASVPLDEVMAPVDSLRTSLLVLGLVLLLAVAGVIAFVAQRMTRPIKLVTDAAERVAEGDTGVALDLSSEDEVGRMAAAFGRTVDYLREKADAAERVAGGDLTVDITPRSEHDTLGHAFRKLVQDLRTVVGRVSSTASGVSDASQQMASSSGEAGLAVGEIAAAISDVASGSQSQVTRVESVRTAAEDASVAALTSAADADAAAKSAAHARQLAGEGLSAADEATAAMAGLATSSGHVTGAIRDLSARSERIGGIVDTITGIAEQTNLLALNAAIEAARAGDQGRGFAVVAEEVRKLAEDSQSAAGEIAGLIGEMQSETTRVVEMVESTTERTASGTATVERARAAFEAIGTAVEDVTGRADTIAEAVRRLSADAERMAAEITEIATVAESASASTEQVSASTQETSASTQEIASSAAELARSAEELERLVGTFTLA